MSNLINSRSNYDQRLCVSLSNNTSVEIGATVNAFLTNGELAVYVNEAAKPGKHNILNVYFVTDIKSTLSGFVAVEGDTYCKISSIILLYSSFYKL